MKLTVYMKPTCTTCRNLDAELKALGADYNKINYYTDNLDSGKIRELLEKMGIGARDLLRKKAKEYEALNLEGAEVSEDELIDYMVKHPDLIQRPIVEADDKAVLARPADKIREFLSEL